MQIIVNSQKLLKFLKPFKLDPFLYFNVNSNRMEVRCIDFKSCLGVLQGSFSIDSDIQLNFKVLSTDLLNKLDNFKDDVRFSIDEITQTISMIDPNQSSFRYNIGCEISPNTRKYSQLNLTEGESVKTRFTISNTDFHRVIKVVTAVQSTLSLRCYNSINTPIQLASKKIDSTAIQFLKDEIRNYECYDQLCQYEFYYHPNFTTYLKDTEDIEFNFLYNYLVIKTTDLKGNKLVLYIPLR